ncbi:hypothetical protein [Christiangramia echinicola]|uniref:Uncharacterized protein n=1 Tax=Christiangramia echinicola TaxID=279359 RepID=A0A1H1KUA9_9FLAO|nr:hypothetical protein [Christiangramia echinicola]SDR65928.1 hypothetical protein SAMN04488552_0214 [Christiangramia echinicola]
MKKLILLLIILFTSKTFSQGLQLRNSPKIESEIIFKDGTKEKGLVRMSSSVFDIRFRESPEAEERKVDFEEVDKIITHPDSTNTRVFQYLDNYKHRYKMFAELIKKDEISIYINSPNELELFYSDFDLRSAEEWMNDMRPKNGFSLKIAKSEYLYLAKEDQILIPVEKRRKFTRKYLEYFSDCPEFVRAYKNEEISLKELSDFIEFYKETCD